MDNAEKIENTENIERYYEFIKDVLEDKTDLEYQEQVRLYGAKLRSKYGELNKDILLQIVQNIQCGIDNSKTYNEYVFTQFLAFITIICGIVSYIFSRDADYFIKCLLLIFYSLIIAVVLIWIYKIYYKNHKIKQKLSCLNIAMLIEI